MAKNYMKIIAEKHPGHAVSCDGDQTIYDNITWHDPVIAKATLDAESISIQKADRHEEIFLKTNEILKAGSFTYDGKQFRLSDRAIIRWVGVGVADLKSLLSFPYTVTTMDYQPYEIPSAQAFTAFFGTGLMTAENIEGAGRSLHDAINSCTTQSELDAVVDNR